MYKKISSVEAKALIDKGGYIVVDVREEEELEEGYIDGSVLVPLSDFDNNARAVIPDKAARYLVYCRSGKRSLQAVKRMLELGYENVLDMGGIMDWPFEVVM